MLIRGEEHRDARIATASLPLGGTSGEAAYMAAYDHSEHVLIWINTKPRALYLADKVPRQERCFGPVEPQALLFDLFMNGKHGDKIMPPKRKTPCPTMI